MTLSQRRRAALELFIRATGYADLPHALAAIIRNPTAPLPLKIDAATMLSGVSRAELLCPPRGAMSDTPLQNTATEAAAADAVSARDLLKSDPDFVARATSNIPWVRDRAQRQRDAANAEASKAEVEAAKAADDAQRDGSPQPAPAFDVEAGDLLAGQSVDAEVLELGRGVAADLGLSAEEWSVLKISWSGAVANLDRGGPVMTAEDGIRELARRHGIEGADAILNDARQFLRGISKDRAAEVERMLTETGLGNNPAFAERIAAMHRARQGRKK